MNQELAKELKDAGFPQKIGDGYFIPGELKIGVERVYVPALSELIEACGEIVLWKCGLWHAGTTEDKQTGEYKEIGENHIDDYWYEHNKEKGSGSTPEEAVAHLWLALNKK